MGAKTNAALRGPTPNEVDILCTLRWIMVGAVGHYTSVDLSVSASLWAFAVKPREDGRLK